MLLVLLLRKSHFSDRSQQFRQALLSAQNILREPQKFQGLAFFQEDRDIPHDVRSKIIAVKIQALQFPLGDFFEFFEEVSGKVVSDMALPWLRIKYLRMR